MGTTVTLGNSTERLIRMFNLEKEVADFVEKRVGELAKEKHKFRFSGTSSFCGNASPHAPHVVGSYNTVRYGELFYFCPGMEGHTEEGDLVIVREHAYSGNAEIAGRLEGFWFIKKGDE